MWNVSPRKARLDEAMTPVNLILRWLGYGTLIGLCALFLAWCATMSKEHPKWWRL